MEKPKLVTPLWLKSYHRSGTGPVRQVLLLRCRSNTCDLYFDHRYVECETSTGYYYGFDGDPMKYCPAHFFWQHYRPKHPYILERIYHFERDRATYAPVIQWPRARRHHNTTDE